MAGKINFMPTKHNLNRDLRVMWKKFRDVGREGEMIAHLSVWKARQKQGQGHIKDGVTDLDHLDNSHYRLKFS